ncbi:MAG: hypothetical protein VX436_01510, partial [Planctomycetota bacterium]|nr:hypothetical protein [Planctomycetota bacterium]
MKLREIEVRVLFFVLSVTTAICSSNCFAGNTRVPADALPLISIDSLDYAALFVEDSNREQMGLPSRFAVPTATSITPATHGLWQKLSDDKMRWTCRVRCDNALTMNLGFGRYEMPQSGSMTIMDPSGDFRIRPFTALDNRSHGELWTPVVPSNEAIIEIVINRSEKKLVSRNLELTSINAGYRWLRSGENRGSSESCNVDVMCETGDAWWNEIPSVGVYTLSGYLTCSGAMINNTAEDLTPYFLTANHCGVTSSSDSSIVVYWNHQNSFCREGTASGNNGNGNYSQFTSGSTMRATRSYTDFTLTELSSTPNPAWGVTYSGWSRSSSTSGVGAGIHHPECAEKRISIPDYSSASGEYWNVNWSIGRTAPGSSGSPLYDSNHRIVGQLCCGASYCTNDSNDYYGRSLNQSWSYLVEWLDPLGTNAQTLDTFNSTSAGSGACCIGTQCVVISEFNCDNGGGTYQ